MTREEFIDNLNSFGSDKDAWRWLLEGINTDFV
jgi:hypothetical protein